MEPKQQFSIWYFLIAFLAIVALQEYVMTPTHVNNLPYSDFKTLLKAGKIGNVGLGETVITGTLNNEGLEGVVTGETAERLRKLGRGEHRFTSVRVNDPALVQELEAAKVRFTGQVESKWLSTLLSWIVPAVVFFLIWGYAMKRMGGMHGGMLEIGKSKAKVYMEKDVKVTFDDVAGVDEAKEELKEIIAFLRDPRSYGRLGARVPKGVLLVGPPGTGKTLLARAVAGEAGVPFFSISGSEFVEMFVGVGAARVRDLFEQARKRAPAIIFIDELDALGRARGAFPLGGHDEKEQTLNQLLSELDGFDTSAGLVLLAATNRPEILDPALLRAGRFDRQVLVDRPDKSGRVQILNVHLRKVQLTSDVDPEKIAALTPGFSGADLANLVNEAVLLGGRAAEKIVFDHLSTGAADDLAKVTDIARGMVMRYGMEEKLGHVAYEVERSPFLGVPAAMAPGREFSEETAREIDRAVRTIIEAAFQKASRLLRQKRDLLDRGAQILLQKETLGEEDLREFRDSPALDVDQHATGAVSR